MTSRKMKRLVITMGLLLAAAFSGAVAAKATSKKPDLYGLSEAHWNPLMKPSPLPALAAIEGDPMAGPFMAYMKLPAGFESPPHSHSNDYWAVLVQGKMTHWAADGGSEATSKQLAVGDMTHMPAKVPHISKCYPGEDCIFVLMEKGKFDFIPAAPAKK